MATPVSNDARNKNPGKWLALAQELGPDFGSRAAQHDAEGSFVAENYEIMRQHKLFSAAIPTELGGGGASLAEMGGVLRELARHDGSTALAFSMHSHLLAALVWVWRHNPTQGPEPLLRRAAAEELVLATSGGSDWLEGSGTAVKEDGGFRVSGRKVFGSGSPGAQLFLTTGVYDDPNDGPTVLHFAIDLNGEGVSVLDDWRTLGMRGTGSNSVVLDKVFVPEGQVSLRRPRGQWHPFFDIVTPLALALIMSAYVGVAEGAREIALAWAARKKEDRATQELVGEMDTELLAAQDALGRLIELAADFQPSVQSSNLACQRKTIVARGAIRAVEKAMEAAGGASFFRDLGLERRFRDVQGARFHPLPERRQSEFSGRVALGLDPVKG